MAQGDNRELQRGVATQAEGEQGGEGGQQRDHAHDATAALLNSPGVLGIAKF